MCTKMRQNEDDKKELLRSVHPILFPFSHSVFDSHSIDDARCKIVYCIRIDCAASAIACLSARAHTQYAIKLTKNEGAMQNVRHSLFSYSVWNRFEAIYLRDVGVIDVFGMRIH